MLEIEGIIESIVFRNEENGYTILEIRNGRKKVTVTGVLPELTPGETVCFTGDWVTHPQYGEQLKATGCSLRTPTTPSAIEKYLGSGLITGIGPATAKLIVQAFGKETLEIMTHDPKRLIEISGIGEKRCAIIAESFAQQHHQRETMMFLQSYGISMTMSHKIIKTYGENTKNMIETNPYRMVNDIEGIGFLSADRIAQAMGIPFNSPYRIEAGYTHIMQTAATGYGHTYLPRDVLTDKVRELLKIDDMQLLSEVLQGMLLERKVILHDANGTENIALSGYYYAEKEIAQRLYVLAGRVQTTVHTAIEREIDDFEKNHRIRLSVLQREAVTEAVDKGVMVITGGPGTGKTTIINCILSLMGKGTFLAAPTGRAAKRMTEATGREAKTLHRLLEYSGEIERFARDENNPLDCECLIVDELSMVDIFLMRSMLRALKPGSRLIMVGDADQLPSVGAGNVLHDILASKALPCVYLKDIYRQDESSQIVLNAHRINQGEMPLCNAKNSDFFLIREQIPEKAAASIVSLCAERLPAFLGSSDRLQDIQVLAPTKKGVCGVQALNKALQQVLNPPGHHKPEMIYGDTVFRLGDKVMHVKNNYSLEWINTLNGQMGEGVFNGDMGFITAISKEEKSLKVRYDDGRESEYMFQDLEELELAYCLSVHKSQGSEFPCVVMPVTGGPPLLLTRNLFYTALTRACRLVVLVGQESVIRRMVENDHIATRFTALREQLCDIFCLT